jgi:hypothetical protein
MGDGKGFKRGERERMRVKRRSKRGKMV